MARSVLLLLSFLVVASVATIGHASSNDSAEEVVVVERLLSSDVKLMPAETIAELKKLDESRMIAGLFRVSKLLSLNRALCNKDSLITHRSLVRLAENKFKNQLNSLLDFLRISEESLIIKCNDYLVQELGNPDELLKDSINDIKNTNGMVDQLSKLSARQLLNGAYAKEDFLKPCHKAREVLQPFELVYQGAVRYNLVQILNNQRLEEWARLYKNCDRILYMANPYESRW